jgi:hypothetical protein
MKRRKSAQFAEQETSGLAGVIGHELNNIAVPLEGFAELAIQSASASESVGHILEEIKIAISRIKSLASDLESLGEITRRAGAVAIDDCMPREEAAADRPGTPRIDWRCRASTLVAVDRAHARRALHALANVTGRSSSQSESLSGWSVVHPSKSAARCAACGGTQVRKNHLLVQGFSSPAVSDEMLRDPFGWPRAGRATRRLALAILVHSAHRAGGHIILDEGTGSVSVALPMA